MSSKINTRRNFVLTGGSLFLAGCAEVQTNTDGEAKSKLSNIGTKSHPAYSTAEFTKDRASSWPQASEIVPGNLVQKFIVETSGVQFDLQSLKRELSKGWVQGLEPAAYRFRNANQGAAALIRYLSDMKYGLTSPNFASATHLAIKVANSGNFAKALQDQIPQGYLYQRLYDGVQNALRRKKTNSANYKAVQVTFEKLRLDLEPDLFSQPVVAVNIANFDLQAYDQGKIELGSKVIVGEQGKNSPVGRDYISNLKFSPDWTMPSSIIKRSFFDILLNTPEKLIERGIEVRLNGKVVEDLSTVDWTKTKPSQVGMRQLPGPNNVLGGVRFTLNNSNAIFLHHTNTPQLFNRNVRAISAGCIRVQKSAELAHWILQKDGQSDWDEPRIKEAMERGETSYAKLKKRLNVEMLYHQAWVDHTGVLRLGTDIYERDAELQSKLSALSKPV